MRKWDRSCDAVIARECESRVVTSDWYMVVGPGCDAEPVPCYSADLVAIARAGEAWRTSDDDIDRTIQVYSAIERMDLPFRAECSENYRDGPSYEWRTFKGEGDSYAEALAWALYEAVKGRDGK